MNFNSPRPIQELRTQQPDAKIPSGWNLAAKIESEGREPPLLTFQLLESQTSRLLDSSTSRLHYQLLYAVPSCPVSSDPLCTSTIPVVVWLAPVGTSSVSVCQVSLEWVKGSTGSPPRR